MKFVEFKENFKKGAKKKWDFVKEHKVEIGLTIATTVSGIGLIVLGKKLYKLDTPHKSINVPNMASTLPDFIRTIDEEVFTDLAPEIENLIINDGVTITQYMRLTDEELAAYLESDN